LTQRDRVLCDCGRLALVFQTPSAWDFEIHCECGYAAVLSWAHYNPPPTFTRSAEQLTLLGMPVLVDPSVPVGEVELVTVEPLD
jgi:hypothetical protein